MFIFVRLPSFEFVRVHFSLDLASSSHRAEPVECMLHSMGYQMLAPADMVTQISGPLWDFGGGSVAGGPPVGHRWLGVRWRRLWACRQGEPLVCFCTFVSLVWSSADGQSMIAVDRLICVCAVQGTRVFCWKFQACLFGPFSFEPGTGTPR